MIEKQAELFDNSEWVLGSDEAWTCPRCDYTGPHDDFDCVGACSDNIFCPQCGCEFDYEHGPHCGCDPSSKACLGTGRLFGFHGFGSVNWERHTVWVPEWNSPGKVKENHWTDKL